MDLKVGVNDPRLLASFMARFLTFQQVVSLPGSIGQVGVGDGKNLVLYAQLLDIFAPRSSSRKVLGFDTLGGYVSDDHIDSRSIERYRKFAQHGVAEEIEILALIREYSETAPLWGRENSRLKFHKIDVSKDNLDSITEGLRFCLVEIDVNLYEPTRAALKHFSEKMVPGGRIILGGYGQDIWEGESRAVEEYLSESKHELEVINFSNYPSSVIKF